MWTIFTLAEKERASLLKKYYLSFKLKKEIKLESMQDIKKSAYQLPNFDKEFDTTIKFWIPNIVFHCINQEAENNFKTNSIAHTIREILLIHCYGMSAVIYFREKYRNKSTELEKIPELNTRFSISALANKRKRQSLGKNIQDIKIACHHKLKEDLTTLANLEKLSLSEYLRREITKHYLGNGFNPEIILTDEEEQNIKQFLEEND
ncbi:hypothetical protein B0187_08000 [Haemophilus paracuniculus]|uniref:Uncharacterized protein n=1 Tax=Haemophilus paracuniculus TaxID=734 RepID=A0A1T0ARD8_9PAST|nr:hypothetical protein [Haemophilus paracuniculus]OOR98595.1 hypothetical protein B0187_08000 [Haemophilus paracuniculus]